MIFARGIVTQDTVLRALLPESQVSHQGNPVRHAILSDIITRRMKRRPRDLPRSISIRRSSHGVAVTMDGHQPGPQAQYHRRPDEAPEIIFGVEPVREMIEAAPSRIRALYVKHGTETRFEPQMQ